MGMPTYERRYFLSLLTKQAREREEEAENMVSKPNSNAKGNRTTKVSGDALKNKFKMGDIPLN